MDDIDLCVSGRLCLFGEHSDWAGEYRRINDKLPIGYSIVVGTNHKIYASIKSLPNRLRITSTLPDGQVKGPCNIELSEKCLRNTALSGGFFSYCAGVASYIKRNFDVDGLCVHNYKMDLPIQKGLSSSAAICVLIAKAFNIKYNLKLTYRGIMEVAYQGEIMTPSRCGRMDQACVYGSTPTLLQFDGDSIYLEPVIPKIPLHFVIVDLNRHKDTKKILFDLHRHYSTFFTETSRNLQKALGELNERTVAQAKAAIELGDCCKIGELMNEAQANFDKYVVPACPSELKAPRLHEVLHYSKIKHLIWGGKGVGSQGDGSVQFLTRGVNEQQLLIEKLENDFYDISCFSLTVPSGKVTAQVN
ncbi:MAG: hypothetical protein K8R67_05760 [Desulfobacteraceae bacterium]|nr:hypothetical protein [Desulfobacteraceae bacterium]